MACERFPVGRSGEGNWTSPGWGLLLCVRLFPPNCSVLAATIHAGLPGSNSRHVHVETVGYSVSVASCDFVELSGPEQMSKLHVASEAFATSQ